MRLRHLLIAAILLFAACIPSVANKFDQEQQFRTSTKSENYSTLDSRITLLEDSQTKILEQQKQIAEQVDAIAISIEKSHGGK